jgi:hypothetical protein
MFLKLEGFSGISPRTGPSNLAPNQAQTANNIKLQSGELRPWRLPVDVYTPGNSNIQSIYRLSNSNTGTSIWLEWTTDVNVVPGPVSDTTDFRVYYTDGTAPRKTNWALANSGGAKPYPNSSLKMGVPAPTGAPTLAAAGTGTTPVETRAYVFTYISTFGSVLEESAPSLPATITCNSSGDTVTVSGFGTAPTTSAGYNITAIRIYRSVSSGTNVLLEYVGQVTVNPATGAASGTFADNLTVAQLGVTLPSLYYTPPPATLQGLVTMPNGILAGFTGNQVWFCEPYLPHAWPSSYMMTVGSPIVGLGVFGQTLVVCTTRNPYLITGSTPGAMSQEKLPLLEPCVNKRSIVGDQFGVLYASPNGVVTISQGGFDVLSRPLMTRDEWAVYDTGLMLGAIYQNMYILFTRLNGVRTTLVFIRGDNPPLITMDGGADAAFVDASTAIVYTIDPSTGHIYQLDADPVNNMTFTWKSKKFIMVEPCTFGALKLQADWAYISDTSSYNAAVAAIQAANNVIWSSGTALNGAINTTTVDGMRVGGNALAVLPSTAALRNVVATISAENAVVYAVQLTSQEPVRIPALSRAYIWEVTLTGNAPIRQFAMAGSITELRKV